MENLFWNSVVAHMVWEILDGNDELRRILRSVKCWREGAAHTLGLSCLLPVAMASFPLKDFSDDELVGAWRLEHFRTRCAVYSRTPHQKECGNVLVALDMLTTPTVVFHPDLKRLKAAVTTFQRYYPSLDIAAHVDKDIKGRMLAYQRFWATWLLDVRCADPKSFEAAHDVGILTEAERDVLQLTTSNSTFSR
jgi:hypothetical protein